MLTTACQVAWRGGLSPGCDGRAGPDEQEPTESTAGPADRRGEDRRPLLREWIQEVNDLSAFNRRSRGTGL
ncbi:MULTISPECIES: hypothetical protein [Streptomyces]|uniref:Uncharacterized protein n=1 Tax=Streptomyces radicis TaxID=1750517 RepID=A0A3A9VXY1_9ACTN|nr:MULTISPECIES: hypothetical protein [Streptomyces]RBM16645.1 hypothetical protein DEH69_16450 [Streptomyces sp. PT12]RKN05828.1 hypothetical protein D7319_24175 [Streptomyces radicis]